MSFTFENKVTKSRVVSQRRRNQIRADSKYKQQQLFQDLVRKHTKRQAWTGPKTKKNVDVDVVDVDVDDDDDVEEEGEIDLDFLDEETPEEIERREIEARYREWLNKLKKLDVNVEELNFFTMPSGSFRVILEFMGHIGSTEFLMEWWEKSGMSSFGLQTKNLILKHLRTDVVFDYVINNVDVPIKKFKNPLVFEGKEMKLIRRFSWKPKRKSYVKWLGKLLDFFYLDERLMVTLHEKLGTRKIFLPTYSYEEKQKQIHELEKEMGKSDSPIISKQYWEQIKREKIKFREYLPELHQHSLVYRYVNMIGQRLTDDFTYNSLNLNKWMHSIGHKIGKPGADIDDLTKEWLKLMKEKQLINPWNLRRILSSSTSWPISKLHILRDNEFAQSERGINTFQQVVDFLLRLLEYFTPQKFPIIVDSIMDIFCYACNIFSRTVFLRPPTEHREVTRPREKAKELAVKISKNPITRLYVALGRKPVVFSKFNALRLFGLSKLDFQDFRFMSITRFLLFKKIFQRLLFNGIIKLEHKDLFRDITKRNVKLLKGDVYASDFDERHRNFMYFVEEYKFFLPSTPDEEKKFKTKRLKEMAERRREEGE